MDIGKNTGRLIRSVLLILLAGTAALALRGALPRPGTAAPQAAAPRERLTAPLKAQEEEKMPAERRKSVYTLILAGMDEVSGNTDTILIGRVDAEARRIDLVSIPRDTYVNRPWEVRKINCAYTAARNAGGNGLEGLREVMRGLCGFEADCCAVADLNTVEQAIDLRRSRPDRAAARLFEGGGAAVYFTRLDPESCPGGAVGRLFRRQRPHGGEHRLLPAQRNPVQRRGHSFLHDAEPSRRRGRSELYLRGEGRVAGTSQRGARPL